MKRILLAAALLAPVAASGCGGMSPYTSPYWRFECGQNGAVANPTLYTQGTGATAVGGIMTVPSNAAAQATIAGPRLAMTAADCGQCQTAGPAPTRTGNGPTLAEMATGNGCTLDDLCREVQGVEKRLDKLQGREALPMPKGQ